MSDWDKDLDEIGCISRAALPETISMDVVDQIKTLTQENAALQARIAELENPWISVDDRLPEIIGKDQAASGMFLVTRDCGKGTMQSYAVTFMWSDKYASHERWNNQETMGYRVTHWQPLPPTPEVKSHE